MSDEAIAIKQQRTLSCGLIMPISQLDNLPPAHWDEIKEIITTTVEGISDPKFSARLVSEGDDAGVIHKRIIQNVYSDDIAVCDVSGRNANVMFELGMRLAFDKPTVIIKDDQTPRIFDTDVIEYVTYRRDLRHGPMEAFKAKLASKVLSTYQQAQQDHDKQSFLKSFGTFKVVKLDEASEGADTAMLSMMAHMQRQLSRLLNAKGGTSSYKKLSVPREDLDIILQHPRLKEAVEFVRNWADSNPSFDHSDATSDNAFIGEAFSKLPSEFTATRQRLQALADYSIV